MTLNRRRLNMVVRAIAVGYLLGHWYPRDWAGGLAALVVIVLGAADLVRDIRAWRAERREP